MTRFCLRSLSLAFLCLLICISGHRAKGQDTNSTASSDPAPTNQTTDNTTSASDTGVDGTPTTGPSSDTPINGTTAAAPVVTSEQGGAAPGNTTSETSATDAPPASAGETGSAANFSSSEVPTEATTESLPPTSDDKENSTSSAEPTTADTVTNEAATPEPVTSPVESVTSQETTSEQATSTETTQSTDTTTSEPGTTSVQTLAPAGETTASHSQDKEAEAEADFVIKDENNNPCLLASLDFTIRVLYIGQQGQNQTYEASLPDPKDVTVGGSCGQSSSRLQLTWNNTTFALNLTFVLSGPGNRSSGDDASLDVTENTNRSWSLREISLTFDTSDVSVFPGASDRKLQTAIVRDLNLFSTPLGQSYVCHEAQLLSIELQGARLDFNWVHLMPFGVNGTRFSAEAENCLPGGTSESAPGQQDAYLIPLIVACSLAALVVIIVLGYAISRCVTRHQRQSEYKQMP